MLMAGGGGVGGAPGRDAGVKSRVNPAAARRSAGPRLCYVARELPLGVEPHRWPCAPCHAQASARSHTRTHGRVGRGSLGLGLGPNRLSVAQVVLCRRVPFSWLCACYSRAHNYSIGVDCEPRIRPPLVALALCGRSMPTRAEPPVNGTILYLDRIRVMKSLPAACTASRALSAAAASRMSRSATCDRRRRTSASRSSSRTRACAS